MINDCAAKNVHSLHHSSKTRIMASANEMQKPLELAIRKFVFSSFRIFDDTDKRAGVLRQVMGDERSEASAKQAILHRSSRLFREQLSTLLSDIDLVETAFSNQNGHEVTPDMLQPECDLAVYLSMTWHLCEVYFLNQSNRNSLDLINWLKVTMMILIIEKQSFDTYEIMIIL